MGLGHVIDIKHMVFSRIRFNSGQRVQDRESDMGGMFGLCSRTPEEQIACEKEVKAEAGHRCLRPGRAVDGLFSLICFGGDWETSDHSLDQGWCRLVWEWFSVASQPVAMLPCRKWGHMCWLKETPQRPGRPAEMAQDRKTTSVASLWFLFIVYRYFLCGPS